MNHTSGLSKSVFPFLIISLILIVSTPGLMVAPLRFAQAQDEESPYVCAVNESLIRGQDWEVAGGAAGATNILPPGSYAVDYGTLADQFVQMSGAPVVSPDRPVVILVVDDFTTTAYAPVKTGGNLISHGVSVFTVAEQTLNHLPISSPSNITLDKVEIVYEDVFNARQVRVDNMIERIDQVLAQYNDTENPPLFVLNMSFSLIPCEFEVKIPETDPEQVISLNWRVFVSGYFDHQENYSLIKYIEAQGVTPELAPHLAASWLFAYTQYDSSAGLDQLDPLRSYLQEKFAEGTAIVPVASSGNFGDLIPLPDPAFDADSNNMVDSFVPGAWPEVISVSSTKADGDGQVAVGARFQVLSIFSNSGGIAAPGEWHQIFSNSQYEVYAAGTSFAAPVASVWIALMQSTSAITCDFTPWEQQDEQNAYLFDALWHGTATLPAACNQP